MGRGGGNSIRSGTWVKFQGAKIFCSPHISQKIRRQSVVKSGNFHSWELLGIKINIVSCYSHYRMFLRIPGNEVKIPRKSYKWKTIRVMTKKIIIVTIIYILKNSPFLEYDAGIFNLKFYSWKLSIYGINGWKSIFSH